jgi:triacylglycerol lipase
MPLELIEDAKGDPQNAQVLALVSDLAYLAEAAGKEAFQKELGMEAQLVSVGNTQAYVLTSNDHIVAAFRGTEAPTSIEGFKDWLLTDAANLLIVPEGDLGTDFQAAGVGSRWHHGFMKALSDIWDPVVAMIEAERKKSDRPLWVTGHSLGGALALLAAWRLKRKFIPVHQLYTFGAPMVGNAETAKAIDREFADKIFRYVNGPDPIPRLPTFSLLANSYGHCQKEMVLGAAAATAASAGGVFQQFLGKAADGILKGTLIDEFWSGLKNCVGAHAMQEYRDKLVGRGE